MSIANQDHPHNPARVGVIDARIADRVKLMIQDDEGDLVMVPIVFASRSCRTAEPRPAVVNIIVQVTLENADALTKVLGMPIGLGPEDII